MARIRACHGLRMPGTFWIGSGPWFRLEFGSLSGRRFIEMSGKHDPAPHWFYNANAPLLRCHPCLLRGPRACMCMCCWPLAWQGAQCTEDLNSHDSNHLDSTQIKVDMYSYMADHDSVVFCGTIVTFCTNHFSSSLCWWDLMSLESLDWFISFERNCFNSHSCLATCMDARLQMQMWVLSSWQTRSKLGQSGIVVDP